MRRSDLRALCHRFLSTPSARRATLQDCAQIYWLCISIHALREEGDEPISLIFPAMAISIHALREEGDSCTWASLSRQQIFLSTPSARRATNGKSDD